MSTIDCYLVSVPYMTPTYSNAALGILKAVGEQAGFYIKTRCIAQEMMLTYKDENFNICRPGLNLTAISLSDISKTILGKILDSVIDDIINEDPKSVGISIFSNDNAISAIYFANKLRERKFNKPIIAGGFGLKKTLRYEQVLSLTLKPFKSCYEYLIGNNLIDTYVFGDGEKAFVDWLENNSGTTSLNLISTEDKTWPANLPPSNFDGLIMYDNNGQVMSLPVTGSKGCVRKCSFCNIPNLFKNYKWRSGEEIANEMKFLNKKYGVTSFRLTDSLVNGSMKSFRNFLNAMVHINTKENLNIKWRGHYICRPSHQTPDDIYSLMFLAGASNVTIGLESGSNDVLKHMNKKMTIEDFWHEMINFRKFNLKASVLLLGSYYTETWDNFLETVVAIRDMQTYVADGTISSIQVGRPLRISNDDSVPLSRMIYDDNVIVSNFRSDIWLNFNNTDLNHKERIRRWIINMSVVEETAYYTSFGLLAPNVTKMLSNYDTDKIQKFEKRAVKLFNQYQHGGFEDDISS